jgi:hypothetical protein
MSVDRLNEEKPALSLSNGFDRMLSQALQRHSESVPADFTALVLRRVEQTQEQRILARVVLQERLFLAGCSPMS